MKKLSLLVILVTLAATVGAQSANVIEIDAGDAAKAKELYDAWHKSENDYYQFLSEINSKYLDVPESDKRHGTYCFTVGGIVDFITGVTPTHAGDTAKRECRLYGWEYGVEFSQDFKYIVPHKPQRPRSVTSSGSLDIN